MEKACARAAETGVRMYLYGGRNQGALVQLALNLRRRFPGLQIVGGYSPPVPRALGRGGRRGRRRDQPLPRGHRVGRDRRAQAGEVDGAGCATGSRRPCWSASAPPSTSTPASSPRHRLDAEARAGVGLPPRRRAPPAVAALRPLQPALRDAASRASGCASSSACAAPDPPNVHECAHRCALRTFGAVRRR